MPHALVELIPGDEPDAAPTSGLGLCLSGGGCRAMLLTRLKRMDGALQERLINWGYAVCDAALRKHVDPALRRPDRFPYPTAGV